ncbi:peptidase M23 [Parafrankia colletiae]|uniref:Peptidase M23 n=1 Tax=Parafrankia colletiae TaxID=573497 RepID=A0A1S1R062_9ACTN|nr:M23 family metallopeptidase [Parafrankia colletiae]MCK9900638.1 M23 family metallopeptidase [Frankia sp. Cpl3]OHV38905.1 peptidase M23 [Parafrankia colletiae]
MVSTIGLAMINTTGIAHSEAPAQLEAGPPGTVVGASSLPAGSSVQAGGSAVTTQVVVAAGGTDDLHGDGSVDGEAAEAQRRLGDLLQARDEIVGREALAVVAQRNAAIAAEAERAEAARWVRPIEARITQGFGGSNHHIGVDFGATHGTPIHAAHRGTVIYAGWETGYGNFVQIMHENNVVTSYGHLSRIDVRLGQEVATGQQIGLEGNTGKSTGPHLHFEVRLNGQYGTKVDPLTWLAGHGVHY